MLRLNSSDGRKVADPGGSMDAQMFGENDSASSAARCGLPRVGVGVLIVDESNRVLLTLRLRAPEAGCWSIVGGKLDYLETLESCAIREARGNATVRHRSRSAARKPALGFASVPWVRFAR
jgi:NADH pyrophosphatase NudC (nudix superfamily)